MRPANKKPVYLDEDEMEALRKMRSRRRKKNGRRVRTGVQSTERHPFNRDNLIIILLVLIFLYLVL